MGSCVSLVDTPKKLRLTPSLTKLKITAFLCCKKEAWLLVVYTEQFYILGRGRGGGGGGRQQDGVREMERSQISLPSPLFILHVDLLLGFNFNWI